MFCVSSMDVMVVIALQRCSALVRESERRSNGKICVFGVSSMIFPFEGYAYSFKVGQA